ncbi:MAG: hypothetical protein AAGB12_11760 [Pseudomonadota bacterium]
MKLTRDYLGHPIKVKINDRTIEAVFAGWFLEVALVQQIDDDGYLTGEIHAINAADIAEMPPLIGQPPAVYCPPRD